MRVVSRALIALVVAPLLAAGFYIVATWQSDRSPEELAQKWAPPPSLFLDLDGMHVHIRDEGPRGDPHPIVLLHGTSSSLHTWQGWSDSLQTERRVVRFDLPGFGLTGPFPDDDYKVAHYVAFVEHVLDTLSLDSCVLVGNSFGGNIAWHVALDAPERVHKLVLVDAGGYAYKPKSMPIGFRLAQQPLLRPLLAHLLPRSVVASSVRNVYGDPSKVSDALIDRYFDLTLRAGNRDAVFARFEQTVPGQDIPRLPQLHMPTLILWGASDQLIPSEYGERFHEAIAGSELVLLSGLGHVPHEEDPQRSVAAAQPFLLGRTPTAENDAEKVP